MMSISDCSPPAIPPADPPAAKFRDKSTEAAMRYLLTGDPKAWDHLMAIMFKAKGNLFVPEAELPLRTATCRFYELWLAEKFASYREADADTICSAAERGEFKYLAKQSRNALIDEIRKRYSSEDALDQHLSDEEWWAGRPPRVVSIDAPLDDDSDFTLEDLLAVAPSRNELGGSALGTHPGLEPEALQRAMRDGKREFQRLLGPLHDVLVTVCGLFVASPDDLQQGDPARAVAAARGISVQTARRKLRHLAGIFRRALHAGNSTVRELHQMLTMPGRPTFWTEGSRSGRPQAA